MELLAHVTGFGTFELVSFFLAGAIAELAIGFAIIKRTNPLDKM